MNYLKSLIHSRIFPLLLVGMLVIVILFSLIFINLTRPEISSNQPVHNLDDNSQDLNRVYDEEYLRKAEELSKQPEPFEGRATKIFNFIESLPYNGEFITVKYRISDNGVILQYSAENNQAANKEFDDLLDKHQIESRAWITNLVIQSN